MAILKNGMDESWQLDPSKLREAFAATRRLGDLTKLIYRQVRLMVVLVTETDPRRRHSLSRRLEGVNKQLEGMK